MKITDIKQQTDLHLVRYITRPKGFKEFNIGHPFIVTYWVDDGEKKHRQVTVKGAFTTDLASVPRIGRWFASKTDAIEESVVHDWLYHHQVVSREEADELFLAMMKAYGVGFIRRNVMYRAVKWFGKVTYDT